VQGQERLDAAIEGNWHCQEPKHAGIRS
jgi:hypothetical protein